MPISMENPTLAAAAGILMIAGVPLVLAINWDKIIPAITPMIPPQLVKYPPIQSKIETRSSLSGSHCFFQTNLPGSLCDGYQHDVHNAIPPTEQRDAGYHSRS